MLRILLVEDEVEKRRLVCKALLEVEGIDHSSIVQANDVVTAKRFLKENGFDLLLLDLNLPKRADREAIFEGGLEIVRWLKGPGKNHRPEHVIALTAYEESQVAAQSDFDNFIWELVPFSHESQHWRIRLQQSVRMLLETKMPPFRNDGRYHYDIGIIVALDEIELSSVKKLPASWQERTLRYDDARYFTGTLANDGNTLRLVLLAAPNKGLTYSAIYATKLIQAFRPRVLAMPGICAGLSNRVELGDVVFADPSWDWGSGKLKREAGRDLFQHAPYQVRMKERLRVAVKNLQEDEKWLQGISDQWEAEKPSGMSKIRIGPIASGASVLQSSEKMKEIAAQHKDTLGVEMEIFAVLSAAEYADAPRPIAFAVKGVSDFGDKKKGDSYQAYAAFMSANVALKFACQLLQEDGL